MKRENTKKSQSGLGLSKKVLILVLAFMMVFQYSTVSLSGIVWADENELAGQDQEVQEAVDEAVQEEPGEAEEEALPESDDGGGATEEAAAPEEVVQEEASEGGSSDEEAVVSDAEKEESTEAEEKAEAEVTQPEEKTPEESAPEEGKEEGAEDTWEAKTFEGKANKVNVYVEAPEGAFPDGTTMEVTTVKKAEVIDAVEEAIDSEVAKLRAVDITFYNKDGEEIQPKKKVNVQLTSSAFDEGADLNVVHIKDNGEANVVTSAEFDGNTAEFRTKGFSIYVVVEGKDPDARLNVIFHKADGSTTEMSITQNQIEAGQLNTNIYDPGVGKLEAGEVFKGWTDEENYTAAGLDSTNPAWTIADIRDNITTMLNAGTVKDGDEYDLYAMVFESFHVSYRDENATTIHTDEVLYKSGDTTVNYTIDRAYAPYYATKVDDGETLSAKFSGWTQMIPEVEENAPVYQNEDVVDLVKLGLTAVNSNLVIMAKVDYGHWIIFNSNASGASFTDPAFVQQGKNTVAPTAPTRNGFDFAGWFTSAEYANNIQTWLKDNPDKTAADAPGYFAFGNTISVDQKLYAGWTTAAKADMLVYVWKESLTEGVDYDFETSYVIKNADVGAQMSSYLPSNIDSLVGTASSVTVNNNTSVFIPLDSDTSEANEGFLYEKYTASTDDGLVSNDGQSILNIYFSRRTYTLKFVYGMRNNGNYYLSTTSSSARTCFNPHFCGQYLTDFPQTIASLKLFNNSL